MKTPKDLGHHLLNLRAVLREPRDERVELIEESRAEADHLRDDPFRILVDPIGGSLEADPKLILERVFDAGAEDHELIAQIPQLHHEAMRVVRGPLESCAPEPRVDRIEVPGERWIKHRENRLLAETNLAAEHERLPLRHMLQGLRDLERHAHRVELIAGLLIPRIDPKPGGNRSLTGRILAHEACQRLD